MTTARSVEIIALPQARPPELLRQTLGVWPLPGLSLLAETRQTLTALCVRQPPFTMPPGSPLMAATARRVEVVFTELAGNALRHAQQPIRVHLASTAKAWLIGVDDAAPELTPMVGTLEGDQPGGRGLAIVLSLASSAGWYVTDGIKTVWAEVPDRPPAELLERLRHRRPGFSRTLEA